MKPLALKQGDMNCYCKQQFDKYHTAATKITFEDGEQYCKEWYLLYGLQDYVIIFLAVYIALVNWLLQEVFDFIGKNRSTKNITDNYYYRMVSIFVTQYINTAILYVMAYHSFAAD